MVDVSVLFFFAYLVSSEQETIDEEPPLCEKCSLLFVRIQQGLLNICNSNIYKRHRLLFHLIYCLLNLHYFVKCRYIYIMHNNNNHFCLRHFEPYLLLAYVLYSRI